jgi:hypothetical protein
MASDNGAATELDPRLIEARDSLLLEGEEVAAQEEGDPGQAIILTNTRILILKVGITATGELNGRKASAYALGDVTAVNVRKGPMGAVIQVVANSAETSAGSPPADNVVIFSGAPRVRKCTAIAASIEYALGKPVTRTAPGAAHARASAKEQAAVARKGGREAKSLAEEMYGEMAESEPEAASGPPAAPALRRAPAPAIVIEEVREPEPDIQFGPNPNLPKPARLKLGPNKALVVLGALMVMVLVGVAVTAPLRQPKLPTAMAVPEDTHSASVARCQINELEAYRTVVLSVMDASNAQADEIRSAVRSGNGSAAAGLQARADKLWRRLNAQKAPAGLMAAKQHLVDAVFIRKTATTACAGTGASPEDVRSALARLASADALLRRGLAVIDARKSELESKLVNARAR